MKIIVFLSMFICASNAIPLKKIPAPMQTGTKSFKKKIPFLSSFQKNPDAFISSMETISKVDPEALQEIVSMLRGLLETSQSREQELDEDLQEKTGAFDEANRAVGEAEDAKRVADEKVEEADRKKTQAEGVAAGAEARLQEESANRDTKETAKNNAKSARDSEINTLDSEQAVLREVIGILENLLNQNTLPPTSAPTLPPSVTSSGPCAVIYDGYNFDGRSLDIGEGNTEFGFVHGNNFNDITSSFTVRGGCSLDVFAHNTWDMPKWGPYTSDQTGNGQPWDNTLSTFICTC